MHFSPTAGQGEAGIWKVEDTWCYLSKSFCVKLELGFPGGSEVKSSTCNAGDLSSIPGRSPGGGNGNPLQYCCLGNPMDGGAWRATVHGVTKSWTRLSNFTFTLPGGSVVKNSTCNAGDPGTIPGSGRSPGDRKGNPLQYSCLANLMARGAWQATVHGVAKSRTRLRDYNNKTCVIFRHSQVGYSHSWRGQK